MWKDDKKANKTLLTYLKYSFQHFRNNLGHLPTPYRLRYITSELIRLHWIRNFHVLTGILRISSVLRNCSQFVAAQIPAGRKTSSHEN